MHKRKSESPLERNDLVKFAVAIRIPFTCDLENGHNAANTWHCLGHTNLLEMGVQTHPFLICWMVSEAVE